MLAASRIIGQPISGVLYNVLRKKVPTEPEVLKNGDLTRRANIDTTKEAYFDAACANHPDLTHEEVLDKYRDILTMLNAKENEFFARVPVYRTPSEIKQLEEDLWRVSLEMTRGDTPLYPSPSWNTCTFCPFSGPCALMNAGADYQFVLDTEYRQRKKELWDAEEEPEGSFNGNNK